MRLYTRQGDDGETGLWGGERTSKANPRIEAIGCVDELNAYLGLCITELSGRHSDISECLSACQRELFAIGADLANPAGSSMAGEGSAARLEVEIDRLSEEAPPLRHFVLPGGCRSAAQLHVARAVARRAERSLVALSDNAPGCRVALRFLNRLSDLLFAAARSVNARTGVEEPIWHG